MFVTLRVLSSVFYSIFVFSLDVQYHLLCWLHLFLFSTSEVKTFNKLTACKCHGGTKNLSPLVLPTLSWYHLSAVGVWAVTERESKYRELFPLIFLLGGNKNEIGVLKYRICLRQNSWRNRVKQGWFEFPGMMGGSGNQNIEVGIGLWEPVLFTWATGWAVRVLWTLRVCMWELSVSQTIYLFIAFGRIFLYTK